MSQYVELLLENILIPSWSFSSKKYCSQMSHTVLFSLLSDISYTLTLDADLQASRVTSRGLFTKNNERFLTEKAKISSTPLCRDYQVYVQVIMKMTCFAVIKEHQWLFLCEHLDEIRLILLHKETKGILKIISWFSLYGFFYRRHQTLSIPSVWR